MEELLGLMETEAMGVPQQVDEEVLAEKKGQQLQQGEKSRGVKRRLEQSSGRRGHPAPAPPAVGWRQSLALWNPSIAADEAWLVGRPNDDDDAKYTVRSARQLHTTPKGEVLRQEAVDTLKTRFLALGSEMGIKLTSEDFEKWQFSRKLNEHEGPGADPLLPSNAFDDPDLKALLKRQGLKGQQPTMLGREMGKASNQLKKTLAKKLTALAAAAAAGKGRHRDRDRERGEVRVEVGEEETVLSLGKTRLRLNTAHYHKMSAMYWRALETGKSPSGSSPGPPTGGDRDADTDRDITSGLHDALFCALLRYESMQGGGFQAAIPGHVFDALLKHFDVRLECFASPFNSRYGQFCSAFLDTDQAFGSVGSFFRFRPVEGSFEANPPFVPAVVLRMASHMKNLLSCTAHALSFVVIVPTWEQDPGWKALRSSDFLRRHVRLSQKDHGYCEGKQHLRKSRTRVASFGTSVFFLQNEAAHKRWPPSNEAVEDLKAAFVFVREGEGEGQDRVKGEGQDRVKDKSGGAKSAKKEEKEEKKKKKKRRKRKPSQS